NTLFFGVVFLGAMYLLPQRGRVQVLLHETFPSPAVAVEPLQVFEGLERAFPAKPVQRPKQNHIEMLQSSIVEHAGVRDPSNPRLQPSTSADGNQKIGITTMGC